MQGAGNGLGKGTEPEHGRFYDVGNSKKEGNHKPIEDGTMIDQSLRFISGPI
jgi:hypothetical protein